MKNFVLDNARAWAQSKTQFCMCFDIFPGEIMLSKMRIFQKVFTGIMLIFMGLMTVVTLYAYSRTSGFTRQDMPDAQFIRQKAILEKNDGNKERTAQRI
jgi:hypothetical protein